MIGTHMECVSSNGFNECHLVQIKNLKSFLDNDATLQFMLIFKMSANQLQMPSQLYYGKYGVSL